MLGSGAVEDNRSDGKLVIPVQPENIPYVVVALVKSYVGIDVSPVQFWNIKDKSVALEVSIVGPVVNDVQP